MDDLARRVAEVVMEETVSVGPMGALRIIRGDGEQETVPDYPNDCEAVFGEDGVMNTMIATHGFSQPIMQKFDDGWWVSFDFCESGKIHPILTTAVCLAALAAMEDRDG